MSNLARVYSTNMLTGYGSRKGLPVQQNAGNTDVELPVPAENDTRHAILMSLEDQNSNSALELATK